MAGENPKRLLEYLAEGLVDDPEAVSVERFEEDDGTVVLELCVGADDYGRVIGRGGGPPTPCARSSKPRRRARTATCSSTSSIERRRGV